MFNGKLKIVLTFLFSLIVVGCLQNVSKEQAVPRMPKVELKSMLGRPDLVIIDVRLEGDWKGADLKVRGAVRENPEEAIRSWAEKYPRDKTLVFY
jgi:hypothetical protein